MHNLIKYFSIIFIILFCFNVSYSQSNIDNILKGGEIIVNGLSFFKKDNNESIKNNSNYIENICVKNKLNEKITFIILGIDNEENVIRKEMVIQKDGKECCFEIPKGIYTYEIILSNKEVYKKGEYKFYEDITIVVKND